MAAVPGEILGAGLYVENWVLALGSVDYLAADAPPSPAQHYWTLSAEEQFYLVWPLLVLVGIWLARRHASKKAGIFAVLATGVLASLAYSLWVTATNPAWAYFVTPARAWEFGAGALLAFAPAAARLLPPSVRALLGWAALGALLAGAFVLDESTPMPGTAAIWIVLAAAALIWVEAPGLSWSSDRLLSVRPARALGDISYAVYLWHWPLIILLPYATHHALTTLDKVSVLMATIGLSALTKKLVEDPVRAARRFGLARSRVTFAYAATGALVLTAVCLVPRHDVSREVERTQRVAAELTEEPPDCFGAAARDPRAEDCPNPRLANTLVPAPEAALQDYPDDASCRVHLEADPIEPCRYGERREGVPHVAVVGDSHARVLMTTVERLVDEGRLTADQFVAAGCPWSTHPPWSKSPYAAGCTELRRKFDPFLEAHADDYDAVITTARLTTMRGRPGSSSKDSRRRGREPPSAASRSWSSGTTRRPGTAAAATRSRAWRPCPSHGPTSGAPWTGTSGWTAGSTRSRPRPVVRRERTWSTSRRTTATRTPAPSWSVA